MSDLTRRMALAAGASMLAAPAASAAGERDVARRLRRECERMARDEGLSGAVLLAHDGAPVFRAAYGMRNRADRAANGADTKFNIASIGKLFTSLAVLRLVDAGRLALDGTLADAWPDYPNRDVAAAVTIAQLLSHSAGVPNYVVEAMRTPPQSLITLADTLALFVDAPLTQTPGALFEYSNGGYVILGRLVEKITGEDFFDHCRRTIFQPLGMRDTDAFRADDIVPNLAVGYLRDLERPGVWRDNTFDVFRGTSAGGSYSTVDDMLRFANAFSRGELLSPALMQAWKNPRFHYHRGQYGLGVSQTVINDHRIVGHAGGHYGVAGELMIFEDMGYTAIVLINGEVETFWSLERTIKGAIAGEDQASRNYWFNRELIAAFESGAAAGEAFFAARGEGFSAREGLIDHYGHKAIHEGNVDAGLAMLTFNRRQFPESLAALWYLAEGHRHARRNSDAIAAYRAYLEASPGDADALRYIAALGG